MKTYQLYIDGQWVDGHSGKYIEVENPITQEIIAKVPQGDEEDVNRAVAAAKKAFETWQYTPVEERVALMQKVVDGLKQRTTELGEIISSELGAPFKIAKEMHSDPYIEEMENYIKFAKNTVYEEKLPHAIVRREPVGVAAGLTPWNFPLEQIEKKVVPALLAGNCVVLKPSQMTPLTAILLTELIDEAGFPKGVYNLVTGRGGEVGNYLALHPDIEMISFTGSTDAGREVARMGLSNIKKIALELGGKSVSLVLPGADFEKAARCTLETICYNTGQTCNAWTRMLVQKNDLKKMEEVLLEQLKGFRMMESADDRDADIGPMSSKKQYDKVVEYIKLGVEEGARMIAGEVPDPNKKDYFIKPVIFSDVDNHMRIAQEEIFGPVLVVIPYDTEEEAIQIANDSIYGLGGAVFGPEEKAQKAARQIKTGSIFVNTGEGDMSAPFGGYKQSGLGREGGMEGYLEYLEVKTIYAD